MHGRPKQQPRPTTASPGAMLAHATGAVTWIDSTRAVVARSAGAGGVSVKVLRHDAPAGVVPFLARVVDEIGDRDRVLIMGPDAMRVELEREYVSIFHRPDRLLDVEVAGPTVRAELVRRLEVLTAG